jgi:hypothetical protein
MYMTYQDMVFDDRTRTLEDIRTYCRSWYWSDVVDAEVSEITSLDGEMTSLDGDTQAYNTPLPWLAYLLPWNWCQ